MRPVAAIPFSLLIILFSCDIFGNKDCDTTARTFTKEEVAFMNFNVNDSVVYESAASGLYYIKCIGKDHKMVDTVRTASDCPKNESLYHYDKLEAHFSTNIPAKKGDLINTINIEMKTGGTSALGTITLGHISSASIFYFGTTPNSSAVIPMDSSRRQYNYSINYHLDEYKIGARDFDDVTVFCKFQNIDAMSPPFPYIVDTLYYQRDVGILKLVVDGKPFVFKNKY